MVLIDTIYSSKDIEYTDTSTKVMENRPKTISPAFLNQKSRESDKVKIFIIQSCTAAGSLID